MYLYWFLFAYFASGTINETERRTVYDRSMPMLLVGCLLIALCIGFRFEVGADWDTYRSMFWVARYTDLDFVLGRGDPAYQLVNWVVQQNGGELWTVNLICGMIFAWGLWRFAHTQARPWLSLVVAIPYLVIVVAMGYTRQAVAIGILLAGLASFFRGGSIIKFALYVTAAALFHRTAVVVFPLVAMAGQRSRLVNGLVGLAGCVLLYDLFLADEMDKYVRNYIDTAYASQGAAIRVAMSLVPATLLLLFGKRFKFNDGEYSVWRNFSIATVVLLVLLIVLPSSTAVDRMALYVIPLQLAVWSRFPGVFTRFDFGAFLVVLYSATVQFTWLNFAAHSKYWVPYEFYPI